MAIDLKKQMANLMHRVGSEIEVIAKVGYVPVATGKLRRNTKARGATHKGVKVGNTAEREYAKYVHDGTKKMKARPYLTNALEEYKKAGLQRALDSFAKETGEKIKADFQDNFRKK